MKDNKLIAEFMIGAWNLENLNMQCDNSYDLYSVSELSDVFTHIESDDLDAKHFFIPDEMLFHISWDWLMPVVQKVESLGYVFNIQGGKAEYGEMISETQCFIAEDKLSSTYKAVVEFIKEHNDARQ